MLKLEYSLPYERLLWNYKNADSQAINKAIKDFYWKKSFCNKNIDEQGHLFNETFVNVFHNYSPNKYATFNDKDTSCLNYQIKLLIKKRMQSFRNTLKTEELMLTTRFYNHVRQN